MRMQCADVRRSGLGRAVLRPHMCHIQHSLMMKATSSLVSVLAGDMSSVKQVHVAYYTAVDGLERYGRQNVRAKA